MWGGGGGGVGWGVVVFFFFFNDTATTEIYTLSLHDALPISQLQCLFSHGHGIVFIGWLTGDLIQPEEVFCHAYIATALAYIIPKTGRVVLVQLQGHGKIGRAHV